MNARPAALMVTAAAAALTILPGGTAHAYESKRLDMKVQVRCADDGATQVAIRLHDTRPATVDGERTELEPYAWTWKHSDDGADWNTWGGGDYLRGDQTRVLRFRIKPGQEWLRVAVSDETDTEFARHLMLDRRFHARDC